MLKVLEVTDVTSFSSKQPKLVKVNLRK